MEDKNDIVKVGHITVTIISDFMDDKDNRQTNRPIQYVMTVPDNDSSAYGFDIPSMKHIVHQDDAYTDMLLMALDETKREILSNREG